MIKAALRIIVMTILTNLSVTIVHAQQQPPIEAKQVRMAAKAGPWYPQQASELAALIDGFLTNVKSAKPSGSLRALISPHAGYAFSGQAAAFGFKQIQGLPIKRVIVLGPAHRGNFHGVSIADVTHYQTPLGEIPLDQAAIAQLRTHELVKSDPLVHQNEHSIEMQLPFLQHLIASPWSLVPILVGTMEIDDFAKIAAIIKPLADAETLVIASGDFTHFGQNYGYTPFPVNGETSERIQELDMGAFQTIAALDMRAFMRYRQQTEINACAFGPVAILLQLVLPQTTTNLLRYTTSGEISGDYQHSVSYLSVGFYADQAFADVSTALSKIQLQQLHQLAKAAVKQAVIHGRGQFDPGALVIQGDVPVALAQKSGAFVTLKKAGRLRGCIGYIQPHKPLYRAIIENAANAAVYDQRFLPVEQAELSQLELEISVLSSPKPIKSYHEFTVGKHGIILSKAGRQAVYLPEVAIEQGWTQEQTLSHLAEKAGLPANAWQHGASFKVFTSQKYGAPWIAGEAVNGKQ